MPTSIYFFVIMALFIVCMIVGNFLCRKALPLLITGIIIVVAGLAFLAVAEEYCTFVSVTEEYRVCESTLSLSGKYGKPVYIVTYQKEDGQFEIGKTTHVFHKETPGPDIFALCEYKFLFLKMEKYAFFTDFENVRTTDSSEPAKKE